MIHSPHCFASIEQHQFYPILFCAAILQKYFSPIYFTCISQKANPDIIYIFQNHLSFPQACEKSEALLDYIARFPDKLMLDCYGKPLREWLTGIRWLKPRQEKPIFYPENLQWWVFSFCFLLFYWGEGCPILCFLFTQKTQRYRT